MPDVRLPDGAVKHFDAPVTVAQVASAIGPGRPPPGATPTLLAAAGSAPDPSFPPDGMNLLPVLTQNATPVPRKLFWRYKANWQRAVRDGDFKYLKILDNTFLFNVVADPMERANLKERYKDIYDRLVAEWNEWNAAMLPEIAESGTDNFTGGQLADHIGTRKVSGAPDPDLPTTTPTAQAP